MTAGRKSAVIVVSSHVVRGSVGNRAAVFALETLGYPVWAVPTVFLPWHPGHGPGTKIVPDPQQFCHLLEDLQGSPQLGEVGAVLSGYMGSAEQVAAVASLVRRVKAKNRDAIYLCDPVIGDAGGLYVPEEIAEAIRDLLLPLADIATPNVHELAWLRAHRVPDRVTAAAVARTLGPSSVVVTSVPAGRKGETGTLLVSAGETLIAEHPEIAGAPNGPGDLTAALFLARKMAGDGNAQALRHTTSAVFEILARAVKRGSDELMLTADANSLSHPAASVHLTRPGALAASGG